MKKSLAIAAVMCLTGLVATTPASAGYWMEVTNDEIEGSPAWLSYNSQSLDGEVAWDIPSSWTSDPQWQSQTKDWVDAGEIGAGFIMSSYMTVAGNGGAASSHSEGTRRVKFKWVRNVVNGVPDPDDDPDPVLRVIVYASIESDIFNSTFNNSNDSLITKLQDWSGLTTPQGSGVLINNINKKILLHIKTNGADEVWLPAIYYGARGTVNANGNSDAFIGIHGHFDQYILFDNREIKIVSPTIEDSYQRHLEFGLPSRIPRVRDETDALIVDTALEWSQVDTVYNPLPEAVYEWTGYTILNASLKDYANPTCIWEHSGPGSPTQTPEILSVEDFNGPYAVGHTQARFNAKFGQAPTTPLTNSIKVSATDSDGAIGVNKYTIVWHYPHEWNSTPYATGTKTWDHADPIEITRPVAYQPGSVSGKWSHSKYQASEAIGTLGNFVFTAGSAFSKVPLLSLFLAAAELGWEEFIDSTVDNTDLDASFVAVWESDLNEIPAAAASWIPARPTLSGGGWDNTQTTQSLWYLSDPAKIVEYEEELYEGSSYDTHGYVEEIRRGLKRTTGRISLTGTFRLNSGTP